MGIEDYLEMRVSEIKQKRFFYNEEVKKLPKGSIWTENRNGRIIRYHVTGDKSRPTRRVITNNDELVKQLMRRAYLEAELILISENEKVFCDMLKRYRNGYVEDTIENVLARMRVKGKNPEYENYFAGAFLQLEAPVDTKRYSREIIEWAKARYTQSEFREENLRHKTSYGLLVRSKSEVIIAEKLYEYKIAFRYEEVIERDGVRIVPDFTIKTSDGRTIIWEHAGRMSDPEYAKRHKLKLEIYEQLGFYPWKNLIVTYDDEDGYIDMRIIKSEIENRIL